jgi:hypothetical protein
VIRKLFPTTFKEAVAALAGGLSITVLVAQSYSNGFFNALGTVLSYYDRLVGKLLGWAKEPLESLFEALFSWQITLHPIWAHVTVLSGIYLMRNVHRLYAYGKPAAATYQLVFAVPIMLLAGVGAGTNYQPGRGYSSEVNVTIPPLLGLFAMTSLQGVWFAFFPQDRGYRTWPDFGGTRLHFVKTQIWYGARLVLVGLALSFLFTFVLMVSGIPNPSVLVLLALVICLALYWLSVGDGIVRQRELGRKGQPRVAKTHMLAVLDTPAGRLALTMLHTVEVFLSFVLASAGLNLLGL